MPGLSSNSRRLLLDLAAAAIKAHLTTGEVPEFVPTEPETGRLAGCFVTLRKNGLLRGCVGTFDRARPLYDNVRRMAVAAAFQDIRFPPVNRDELKDLNIEISVLGEPFKMNTLEDLNLGRHGVLVKLGARSGTYLPEVAVDEDWSALDFVTHCAREKAGLSPEECARAEVYLYEVEKIGRT
jgi:AmmeMemoRadiSam system protein A